MILALADKTGWNERFILWELPLCRALEYYHAVLWSNGAWTVRHEKTAAEQLAMLLGVDVEDDEE